MSSTHGGPFPGTYWVEPGRLLAGPYPDDVGPLLELGIVATLDLTEAEEGWPDYWSEAPGLDHRRAPLRDFAPPTPEGMERALEALEGLLESGQAVYLHCRGGRGRTGCVVACLLVDRGATPASALDTLRGWCGHEHSPETDEQRAFVRTFRRAPRAAGGSEPRQGSS